jgi:predicted RNase H-like nuclease (RuvC/YqgF family)
MSISATLVPAIAMLVAAIGTYIAMARKLSGKIATSEAEQLWKESAAIREDYRSRIQHSDAKIVALESRVCALEKANVDLLQRNSVLVLKNERLEARIEELRNSLASVHTENMELKKVIASLRKANDA